MAPACHDPCQAGFISRRSSVAIAQDLYPLFEMLAAGVWTTEPADDHDTASHGFQLIVTEHARSQVRFRRKALDLAHGLLSLIVWLSVFCATRCLSADRAFGSRVRWRPVAWRWCWVPEGRG